MESSGKRIDYTLRPAKQITRKMLCEAFRRLRPFGPVHEYRYIGLGSYDFVDFALLHKQLGITDMFSIEDDCPERCEFNKPFGSIQVKPGRTTHVLPELLDPPRLTIAWLDYDGPLDDDMLKDINAFCSVAPSGSMLVVTVNAHSVDTKGRHPKKNRKLREGLRWNLRRLESNVGEARVSGIDYADLADWGLAGVSQRIISNQIAATLVERNAGLPGPEVTLYNQLFNFHYRDGARMLAVGGLLSKQADSSKVAQCYFDELEFIARDHDARLIGLPRLTLRERRYLDQALPDDLPEDLDEWQIPEEDVGWYREVYRYFPTYAEAEL